MKNTYFRSNNGKCSQCDKEIKTFFCLGYVYAFSLTYLSNVHMSTYIFARHRQAHLRKTQLGISFVIVTTLIYMPLFWNNVRCNETNLLHGSHER